MKEEVLKFIKSRVQAQIDETFVGLDQSKEAMLDAPGRMESRYDTRKEDETFYTTQLNGLLANQQSLRLLVEKLIAGSEVPPSDKVGIGSIVTCYMKEDDERIIFLFAETCGGNTYATEIGEITVITWHSPLGGKLFSQPVNSTIRHGQMTYDIENIE